MPAVAEAICWACAGAAPRCVSPISTTDEVGLFRFVKVLGSGKKTKPSATFDTP